MSFTLIFYLALAAGVAFIVGRVITVYASTKGTRWERLLATAKGSATILKEYVAILGGAALVAVDKVLDVLSLSETQLFLKQNVSAEVMGWVLIASALLTIVARLRTLWGLR